jgi:thiamine-phosphate pyrophosphorylase
VSRAGSKRPLLYYITDRRQFAGDEYGKRQSLLRKIAECSAAGVDYVQLREKDLSVRELEHLAKEARAAIPEGSPTRLLINSRMDVALACGAHGVHLPANSLPASEARAAWVKAAQGRPAPLISVSTHSLREAQAAEAHGADFVVFGPVFEKDGRANPAGLQQLKEACSSTAIPVLAIGGVTPENAQLCLEAGAAGVAGIRLFQSADIEALVAELHAAGRR